MNCAVCARELPPGAMFCGECGSSVSAAPRPAVTREHLSDTSVLPPVPPVAATVVAQSRPGAQESFQQITGGQGQPGQGQPDQAAPDQAAPDQGRIRQPAEASAFLLRFSTGETAAISGPGLIGRNPVAQPGEQIPTLIPITDEQRTVSKTHLEVGVTEGRMWVSDRFSANGSLRVESGGYQRRLEPGRRYLIESGTRIVIGEQWVEFVLPEPIGR